MGARIPFPEQTTELVMLRVLVITPSAAVINWRLNFPSSILWSHPLSLCSMETCSQDGAGPPGHCQYPCMKYSLFTLRKAHSTLDINGQWGFLIEHGRKAHIHNACNGLTHNRIRSRGGGEYFSVYPWFHNTEVLWNEKWTQKIACAKYTAYSAR